MGMWELIVVAIGVSMDAFAIAICKGLSVERLEKKHMVCAGLWFGGAQALMPLIGYLLGSTLPTPSPASTTGCHLRCWRSSAQT